MALQRIYHGVAVDILTADELYKMIKRPERKTRMRVAAQLPINSGVVSGASGDVYKVPSGMELEIRRVVFSVTGNDPAVDGNLGQSGSNNFVIQPLPLGQCAGNTAQGANAILTPTLNYFGGIFGDLYLTGFEVTGAGATAGSVIDVTITGVQEGTQHYRVVVPAGAGVSITPLIVEFPKPLIAAAANIVLTVPAFGAGNTDAAANIHGYYQGLSGKTLNYLRSGQLLEPAQPQFGSRIQVPGVQTWGDEQGPYLRNGEVFGVAASGLGNVNKNLAVYMEGILTEPASDSDR